MTYYMRYCSSTNHNHQRYTLTFIFCSHFLLNASRSAFSKKNMHVVVLPLQYDDDDDDDG
jgi:hypothetical protein